jgi:hypothetical protein
MPGTSAKPERRLIGVHLPMIEAQVTVEPAKFAQLPPWMLLTAAAIVGALLVRRLGPQVNFAKGRTSALLDFAADFFELGLMAAAVAALSSTPLGTSLAKVVLNFETAIAHGVAGHVVTASAGLVFFAISAVLAFWYVRTERLLAAILFGFSVLALTTVSPVADSVLSWFVNDVAAWIWNTVIAIVNYLFVHVSV